MATQTIRTAPNLTEQHVKEVRRLMENLPGIQFCGRPDNMQLKYPHENRYDKQNPYIELTIFSQLTPQDLIDLGTYILRNISPNVTVTLGKQGHFTGLHFS